MTQPTAALRELVVVVKNWNKPKKFVKTRTRTSVKIKMKPMMIGRMIVGWDTWRMQWL